MFCLHLIPFRNRKWYARKGEEEWNLQNRTKTIQHFSKNEMGLLVDKVKPGRSGTSNDGNIARSFLMIENLLELLVSTKTYLQTLSKSAVLFIRIWTEHWRIRYVKKKGHGKINYLLKNTHGSTCQSFFIKYWSMDPILFLGALIRHLSEDAQESRNKDLRRGHSRKIITVFNEWRCF